VGQWFATGWGLAHPSNCAIQAAHATMQNSRSLGGISARSPIASVKERVSYASIFSPFDDDVELYSFNVDFVIGK